MILIYKRLIQVKAQFKKQTWTHWHME